MKNFSKSVQICEECGHESVAPLFGPPCAFVTDCSLKGRSTANKVSPRGAARRYALADGSSTRGGSTSVRGRVRGPHTAKLQAASVSIA